MEWALRWNRPSAGGSHKFHHFEDHFHLDEKWFYICKNRQTYYIYDNEELPTHVHTISQTLPATCAYNIILLEKLPAHGSLLVHLGIPMPKFTYPVENRGW